jgi:hypothetical protein
VAAVAKVPSISRQACRDHVALNFGVGRMVDGYEAVYRQLINERLSAPPLSAPARHPSPPSPAAQERPRDRPDRPWQRSQPATMFP